jgi:hypothetical protein
MSVSLRQVIDEVECLMDGCTAYLSRRTGELYTLQDEEAGLLEEEADSDSLPEWQREQLPKIREIPESGDWLPLPTSSDIHEWAIMEQFCRTVAEPELRDELLSAIRGRGAFRHFKDVVYRSGIERRWFQYKRAALAQIVMDWLDENAVAYERGEDAALTG